MQNNELANSLNFFSEPFQVLEEDRLLAYRFNIEGSSPYSTGQKWDYSSKSVKTDSGFGIYGLANGEQCLGPIVDRLYRNIIEGDNKATDILMLEVDKRHLLFNNDLEMSFTQCNIIQILTIDEFIARRYPDYQGIVDSYKTAKRFPGEVPREIFLRQYNEANMRIYQATIKVYSRPKNSEYYLNLGCIKNFALSQSNPSEVHGLSHWERVERNGIILAEKTNADLSVVRIFAYVHDMCRVNDGDDIEHGLRAANLLEKYKETLLIGLPSEKLELLKFACISHTRMIKSGNITVDTCFDADRLDLPRVGIQPDPNFMATTPGRMYATSTKEVNY